MAKVTCFLTLSEFLAKLDGPCACPSQNNAAASWRTSDNAFNLEWMGLQQDAKPGEGHYTATRRIVREGWPRGVALLADVASKVQAPNPISIRRRVRWMDAGDSLDMQRVYNGNVDTAWRTVKRGASAGVSRIRILVDSIATGGTDASRMRWRGVAALKLADLMTEAGYSVQVESVFWGKAARQDFLPRVIVKDYEQPLDLPTLAATTALPAFFRSLGHLWGAITDPTGNYPMSYLVCQAKAEQFVDAGDSAPVWMLGQNIVDAGSASGAVNKAIQYFEEANLRVAA